MTELEEALKEIGARNGLEIALDENRACTLELSDGRVMLLQERADMVTERLSANFYWKETFGATISWNADLEEVVMIYPLPLAGATPKSVETVFTRFVELQDAWARRLAGMIADAQEREPEEPDEGEEEEEAVKDDLIITP